MRIKLMPVIFVLSLSFVLPWPGRAAMYNNQTLDGQSIPATALSENGTKTSQVTVLFAGTDALVTYESHRTVTYSLSTETITDAHHLRVYNYDKNTYLDLDLVGLR
jgi:hypothetical protein